MRLDLLNSNIYKSAVLVYWRNIRLVLITSLILVLLKILRQMFALLSSWQDYLGAVGYIVLITLLVISFAFAMQNTIINDTSGIWQSLKKGRRSNKVKYFWHSAIFIVIFLLLPVLVAFFALTLASQIGFEQQDQNNNLTKLIALTVSLPLLGVLFSAYGILLSSIVTDDKVSISSALRRGNPIYLYTFSRFVAGPVTLIILAGWISNTLLMSGVSSSVFSISGNLLLQGIITSYIYYMFRLFLLTLAVVVLCKTYLKSNERAA